MADNFRVYYEKLLETNLERYSNKDLAKLFYNYCTLHKKYYQWCWIPPLAVAMFYSNLTEAFKKHLQEIGVGQNKINGYFVRLTQPTKKSLIQIEPEELLQIANKIQEDKYHGRFFRALFKKFKEQEAIEFGFETHRHKYEDLFEKSAG